MMLAAAVLSILGNVWLSICTSRGSDESKRQEHADLAIYSSIGLAGGLVDCLQALVLTYCALGASRSIHKDMLRSVLRAPLSFFDLSPMGRILNRFLQDMQNIDSVVPNAIADQITKTLNLVTQLSLVYVEAPWVLVSLPILIIPYQAIFRRMRIPNRDARRIESVARSPVYAHFSDTLAGRETIRAYSAEERFVGQNLSQVGNMATACYGNNAVSKWAQMLTTQWGCFLYLAAGLSCVVLHNYGKMASGQIGLVLLYSAQLQRAMMDYMMGAAEVEKNFVSVERIAEYIRLEPEEALGVERHDSAAEEFTRPAGWPCGVRIAMEDVRLRYRLHRPLVWKGVNLDIGSREKVAICGRTGCGKSSLFGALCRLYPIAEGKVTFGDVDISKVPLSVLREHVRVVSQEAFLLSGTLRQNLALNREHAVADEVIWHCLSVVGMADAIKQRGGLLCEVEQSGQNFSVGERQLLSLARVLIPLGECCSLEQWRPPAILLCDEATASVDLVVDEKVHDVLLNLDSTVLMICHRLQHIRRFQRVIVMEAGVVKEDQPPAELLARNSGEQSRSLLAKLCEEAGVGIS
eukprot:TRINITY_DN25931_c0_g1_i1.p1 TRINITY_DN25931_c0_g1~~TRINITY_DN25931_c0_g1_i1.p1  ORF type:complete len:617 (-),score=53.38 TRINITY_DN25931_c0_g1_i1:140-1873(-)